MFITTFLKKIAGWITSNAAKRAFAEAERIYPLVLPIVKAIGEATKNRTVTNIAAQFELRGVPWIEAYADDPTWALQKLARELVRRTVPEVGQSVANLAIEAAVNAVKE